MNKKAIFISLSFLLFSFILNAAERTYSERKFYDKNKTGTQYDKSACWAASTANILKSWHDSLKKQGVVFPKGTPYSLDDIYEKVYKQGDSSKKKIAQGNSVRNGIAWFIAGIVHEDNEYNTSGGGYWKEVYSGVDSLDDLTTHIDISSASVSLEALDIIFANSIKKNSRISISLECDAFEDGEKVPSHAITFWGYESKSKRATAVYITDSDDNFEGKKKFLLKQEKDKKIYLVDYSNSNKKYYINYLIEFDMLLDPRIKDRYVSASIGDDLNNGSNWKKAFKNIHAALRSIKPIAGINTTDCKIHIEEGVYSGSEHTRLIQITNGYQSDIDVQNYINKMSVSLLGGYSKNNKSRSPLNKSIISPNSDKSFSLIYVKDSKLILDSISFDGKNKTHGLSLYSSDVKLQNSSIENAMSAEVGGAIYLDGKLSISNSKIFNNSSKKSGGAIYARGELLIESSSIFNNKAEEYSAGIYIDGELSMQNSTIAKNSSKQASALFISGQNTNSKIDFCTIAENSSEKKHSIYLQENSNLTISNTIIWKNNFLSFGNLLCTDSLIDNYNLDKKNNAYETKKKLQSRYEKCMQWNTLGYYLPKMTLLKTKNQSQDKDQLGNKRVRGCIGAVEYK